MKEKKKKRKEGGKGERERGGKEREKERERERKKQLRDPLTLPCVSYGREIPKGFSDLSLSGL